ncbi:Uncharacterized protein FKW44_009845, partial [Caligus rogercresseyi]
EDPLRYSLPQTRNSSVFLSLLSSPLSLIPTQSKPSSPPCHSGQRILSADIPIGSTTLPTAAPGESITVINQNGKVAVQTSSGTAVVTHVDIEADNGVVHAINGII